MRWRWLVWLILGACHAQRPVLPALSPPPITIASVVTPAEDREVPLELRVLETCSAPPIPSDAGFFTDEGGLADNVRFEVPYGEDVKQTFDVTWPKDGARHPMVAIIHGGGWTAGDKHLFHPTMRALADHGYVAASLNYRLARDAARAFPVGIHDARCGLAFLVKHAAQFGGDPDRLALIGASAGGHIAAMIGVAPAAYAEGCDDVKLRISGVISYYAPLDLRKMEGYPPNMQMAVWELLRVDGGTPEWSARAAAATPETLLDESAPPFLLVHGAADTIVPPDDSRGFKRALDAHNVPSLFVEVPAQKHGFTVLGRKDGLLGATCTAWDFLERVLARARVPRERGER